MENGKMNKARKSRIMEFTRDETILLIKFVEEQPIIWDLSHSKHYDSVCLRKAWEEIGSMLDKAINTCKNAWRSLRDSRKYYTKAKGMKSGSAGGVPLPGPSGKENVVWDFEPYMSFLPHISTKRETYHSQFSADDDSMNCSMLQEPDEDSSLYPYAGKKPAKKQKVSEPSSSEKLCGVLSELVQEQRVRSSVRSRPILAYWESELNMMTPEDAADVEQKMTKLLWTEKALKELNKL